MTRCCLSCRRAANAAFYSLRLIPPVARFGPTPSFPPVCCHSQAHLKKLFQGIHSVSFSEDKKTIVAMCSVAGEVVPLHAPVAITGAWR